MENVDQVKYGAFFEDADDDGEGDIFFVIGVYETAKDALIHLSIYALLSVFGRYSKEDVKNAVDFLYNHIERESLNLNLRVGDKIYHARALTAEEAKEFAN